MKVFKLTNPAEESIKVKFMSGGSGLPLTSFPPMIVSELIAPGYGNEPIDEILLFSPNYIRVGKSIFRVICTVVGDVNDIYVTQESGQIIDFVQKDSLDFINITQIQQVSTKMGIALKN